MRAWASARGLHDGSRAGGRRRKSRHPILGEPPGQLRQEGIAGQRDRARQQCRHPSRWECVCDGDLLRVGDVVLLPTRMRLVWLRGSARLVCSWTDEGTPAARCGPSATAAPQRPGGKTVRLDQGRSRNDWTTPARARARRGPARSAVPERCSLPTEIAWKAMPAYGDRRASITADAEAAEPGQTSSPRARRAAARRARARMSPPCPAGMTTCIPRPTSRPPGRPGGLKRG